MGNQRRQFSAALKAKIAVEAIKAQRTIQQIGSSYAVHPNQITKWKKQLLDFSPEAFSARRVRSEQIDEQLKTELYAEIGRLEDAGAPLNFASYRWQKHCRGLYQTPIAA